MVKKGARGVSNHLFGLILACGVCGGVLAFAAGMGVDNFSQLAVGAAADAMCMGGKDAHCQCNKGIDKKTGKCGNVKGGGKIGCPCRDITSGDEAASGKCAVVGKCKADKADGMMPMLPMLPMPMPKMSMPMMMQPNCPPKNNSNATTSTSTVNAARTAADTGGGYSDPNCPPESFGTQSGGNFWGSVWDNVNPFASPDDTNDSDTGTDDDTGTTNTNSVWGNLMKSLGISNDSDTDDTDTTGTGSGTGTNTGTSTTTGGVTSKTGTNTTGSTTTTQTTIDFAKSGSTFTYEAEAEEFETQATTVLDQIKKTLEKLLDIVSKWL